MVDFVAAEAESGMKCKRLPVKCKRHIDILGDDLLVAILSRLPSHKTVVICKSVCKQWAALLSQPFFTCRFLLHKLANDTPPFAYTNGLKMTSDRRFGFVVRGKTGTNQNLFWKNEDSWTGFLVRFNDPIYNPKNVSVAHLPMLSNTLPFSLTVVGACNDLFLYELCGDGFYSPTLVLFIANVQTRQWLMLPPLEQRAVHDIGFICDPYCNNSDTSNVSLNNANRACIFVIPFVYRTPHELPVYILSPNTGGMWRNVVLSLPSGRSCMSFCKPFRIGRKFYIYSLGCLFGFDPFVIDDNDVIKGDLLYLPRPLDYSTAIFSEFQEQMYVCDNQSYGIYTLWVLDDYETGQWSVRHQLKVQDLALGGDLLNSYFGVVISFHPTNPDFIYVLCDRCIVLCTFSTREAEVIYQLPTVYNHLFRYGCSFPIMLPAWPSPLPILQ